ncbi:hypothetical protein CDAR_516571 [Caerostris darwini]|uniref:Uncharacterized protein n=1 Tax=Caerostris darwini TaxID=1538125 RepID=A0AAV4WXQ5_9ARAC|nr:hypothetical protein CDAR_516571 [Caerostris darwini]
MNIFCALLSPRFRQSTRTFPLSVEDFAFRSRTVFSGFWPSCSHCKYQPDHSQRFFVFKDGLSQTGMLQFHQDLQDAASQGHCACPFRAISETLCVKLITEIKIKVFLNSFFLKLADI